MKTTREERFAELLYEFNGQRNHTLVPAVMIDVKSFFWVMLFGIIASGNNHQNAGFVLIEDNELFYYSIKGSGRRQKIVARRQLVFNRMERVHGSGGRKNLFNRLEIRWRNNDNRRINVTLGGGTRSQFPNQRANLHEIRKLISSNYIVVTPERRINMNQY